MATGDDTSDHPDARAHADAPVNPHPDAHVNVTIDAAQTPDATPPPPDAHHNPHPDAAANPFCMINNDCTVAGTCCFIAVCVAGTAVGENICLPQ